MKSVLTQSAGTVRFVTILLHVVALFLPSNLKAQEWFPTGATWYYNQVEFLVGETYVRFEVTGDTIIQGKNIKVISGSCLCASGNSGFLYEEGDKIFTYDPVSDSLTLLYDFTLEPGDTLILEGYSVNGEIGVFLIDSITFFQAGTETLRVQHITHLAFDVVWGNKIIERIGSSGCLYPQIGYCDPATGGLRCYEDEDTGLINFQVPPRSCSYTTGTTDPSELPLMNLFPNPATNAVQVQAEIPIDRIILFNSVAIPVYKQSSILQTEFEFDVWLFPAGLYHVQVVLNNHQIVNRLMVIQK